MKQDRLADQLAAQIEEMMAEALPDSGGQMRLASQRELAEMFGASRTSVREALSLLEARGKIRTERGRRSFWLEGAGSAAARSGKVDESVFATRLTSLLSETDYNRSEITRLRHMLEGRAARLAAMQVTDEEIAELEEYQVRMKVFTRSNNFEESAAIDFLFHHAIVRLSRVKLFIDIHMACRELILSAIPMTSVHYTRLWEPIDEHEKIISALRRRDPDEARYYVQSHVERSADRLGISDANIIL